MSTNLHQRPAGRFDRLVAWILDPDGVMYGDERERLRYYESSTVVASLHAVLVPWALVACALLGGRAVAGVVLAIALVFVLPLLVGSAYVQRRRVRTTPTRVTVFLSLSPFTAGQTMRGAKAWAAAARSEI